VKLPGGQRAVVLPEKVREYLLSPLHPVGRFKAAFFVALGYRIDRWQRLQLDLLEIARTSDAALAGQATAFGVKYEVRATLIEPTGRRAELLTVWIVPLESNIPRFVTAFPV
jgi:hypothetical protein